MHGADCCRRHPWCLRHQQGVSLEGGAEALNAEGLGGACGGLRQGGPHCLSLLAEGAAPRSMWKILVG